MRPFCSQSAIDYIYRLPWRNERPWRFLLPDLAPAALDFLARTVTMDPSKRMTVTECLRHPFVNPYHDLNDEPTAPVMDPTLFAFDFEESIEMNAPSRRTDLWDELSLLHFQARMKQPIASAAASRDLVGAPAWAAAPSTC